MDTSESEVSDHDNRDDDEDGGWGCCSCSMKSQCKTTKCECRRMGDSCGGSCGCLPTLCTNRETLAADSSERIDDENKEDNSEKSSELISQGAALLQSVLRERVEAQKDDDGNGSKRKPLSDIGNRPVRPALLLS